MAITRINSTTQTTVVSPNSIPMSEYVGRAGVIIIAAAVTFFFCLILTSVACVASIASAWVCNNGTIVSAAIAAFVSTFLAWMMIVRPSATRSDAENKAIKLDFNDKRAEIVKRQTLDEIEVEDVREMRRIARKGEEAEIDIRVIAAETTRDVMRKLADGVVNGTVEPSHYAHVVRALGGRGTHSAIAAPVIPASTMAPIDKMKVANPESYRVPSVGGASSPVKGKDIQPRHLTCTIRSLREAVHIAESGRMPTRSAFQAYNVKGSEEISDCQKFLQDAGIMDSNSGWGAWAEGLDVNKFGRWVAFVTDSVERNGGEAAYRKAAQMVGKSADANGLIWTTPIFEGGQF